MIEPKPLRKQLREDVTAGAESGQISVWTNKGMLDVLAAERYWRERSDIFEKRLDAIFQQVACWNGNTIEDRIGYGWKRLEFWREAVKKVQLHESTNGYESCAFCGEHGWTVKHKPDCPWLLAQED